MLYECVGVSKPITHQPKSVAFVPIARLSLKDTEVEKTCAVCTLSFDTICPQQYSRLSSTHKILM